jgi:hypothetical protein
MERWMRECVRGFHGFTPDERRSFANQLGWLIYCGGCYCSEPLADEADGPGNAEDGQAGDGGGEACCLHPGPHSLAGQETSGLGLPLFVEQAVIGPAGLMANSVAAGMLYRIILRTEYAMLVARVELKRCTNPGCPRGQPLYEEERCPGDGCGSTYTTEGTEVVAQERLLIQGVYLPVLRWHCFRQREEGHYYRQALCHSEVVGASPRAQYQVAHRRPPAHDECPWAACPYGRPRHSQRGTTLWVRAHLAPRPGPDRDTALRLEACEEGTRVWLGGLDGPARAELRHAREGDAELLDAMAAGTAAPSEGCDDPVGVMEWVFRNGGAVLGRAQVKRLECCIRREVEIRGLRGGAAGS